MQSLTPLRRSYSAVPSSLSSSDDVHSSDQKQVFVSQAQFNIRHPRTIPHHSFLIRTIIFVLLEFGFIALVSAALWKPIILHLSVTAAEVKGATTAVSILWHALAIYAVKDILLNIFSAEWTKLDDGSHNLSLQELDSVSRLTTGFMDQVGHFVSEHATRSFRLGFLSLLLLIVLNGLGPGAIGVNPVPQLYPSSIQVANLTIVPGYAGIRPYVAVLGPTSRVSLITQLEIVENFTTSGYHAARPNILIPWPSLDSTSENTTVTYQTDVIRYDFNCSWVKPSKSNFTGDGDVWVVADQGWTPYYLSSGLHSFGDPTILPLAPADTGPNGPDPEGLETSNSLSSFIFVGKNSTPAFLSLKNLPSMPLPCNTSLNPSFLLGIHIFCEPLVVSFLFCNPQLEILPASINATASTLNATILPGPSTVKNIQREAANVIFSLSLLGATAQVPPAVGSLDAISSRLFLPNNSSRPFKPLSLPDINQNMNKVLASSAKAYLNGYKFKGTDASFPSFATVNTSAIVEVQKLALVGSKPFFMATSVIVGLLVVLLGVLVATTKADQLEGFELENIVKRLRLNYVSSSEA